jgi:hypothetical protein
VTPTPAAANANRGGKARDVMDQGSIIIGTAGVLHVPHIDTPRLYPAHTFKDFALPVVKEAHHWSQWAEACRTGAVPSASFDYSGPLTEAVLLGSVAVRYPNTTLAWDSARLTFTNLPEADVHLRREYRKGWELSG